jgi:hypothetical protein
MKSSLYCENNVTVIFAEEYITILYGKKVIDRFHIGEYESKKIRRIFGEVEKIADRRYLFKSVMRRRLERVRYSPIY